MSKWKYIFQRGSREASDVIGFFVWNFSDGLIPDISHHRPIEYEGALSIVRAAQPVQRCLSR
jgi:hypothetical protein